MFDYWKKVDSLNHMNRLLLAFVAIFILIAAGLIIALVFLVGYNHPKPTEMDFADEINSF